VVANLACTTVRRPRKWRIIAYLFHDAHVEHELLTRSIATLATTLRRPPWPSQRLLAGKRRDR
jgi:hypothetical protein